MAEDFEGFRNGKIDGAVIRDLRHFKGSRGWLAELFRNDELESEFRPAMAYSSSTNPGVTRGPRMDD